MIEQRLEEYLKALPALAGIIGYYAFVIPERADLPSVVYFRVDTTRDYSHSGEDGHKEARVQVTVWATSYVQAKTLGNALIAALNAWTGVYNDVTIHTTEILNEMDQHEDHKRIYGVMVDLAVSYTA